jgi:hypothetical protein
MELIPSKREEEREKEARKYKRERKKGERSTW